MADKVPYPGRYEDGLEVNHDDQGLQTTVDRAGPSKVNPESRTTTVVEPSSFPASESPPNGGRGSRNVVPYGLHPWMFAFLIALVTAIVVGGAVGGGVGAAVSSHKSCSASNLASNSPNPSPSNSSSPSNSPAVSTCSNATTAPTTTVETNLTDYAPSPPQNVYSLAGNCSNTTYTTEFQTPPQQFVISCGVDMYNNIVAEQGGVVADLMGTIAYSAEECMEACSSYNKISNIWDVKSTCHAISFFTRMSLLVTTDGANCWLKNATAVSPVTCSDCLSATLLA